MKLKLTNDETLALLEVVRLLCLSYRQDLGSLFMNEKLMLALLEEMMMSISRKCFVKKEKYTIHLKPTWAIAFHIAALGSIQLETYEGRAVQKICDQIHQAYS